MPSWKALKRSTKTWLLAVAVFLGYVLLAVILVLLLRVRGARMWWTIGGLTTLGLVSASLLLWFLRDTLTRVLPSSTAGTIDATLAAAKAQLAASKRAGAASTHLGGLPVLLVVGPTGATKTTTIVRSGLDPELLAGDVFQGDTVATTEAVNFWYAQSTVVVEAGGALVRDVSSWQRLLRELRPRSLRAALTGRPQAPRLALVCFGCDEFYKPGSGEAVPAAAREIRARLGEAARQFGVQLPTYIVFTKLDTIPHFDAYTRNLSPEEAREPLGASVYPDAGGAGTYADRITPRLDQTFGELSASLAERRLQALSREHAPEYKPGAYEFPREFNKLRAMTIDFAREIGRPSELHVSPVLRGFYFTGVQAVYVTDAAQENAAVPQQAAQQAGVRNATAVFGAGGKPAASAAASVAASATRKVPRWDFLPRVMREVVFGDKAAIRLTAAGARVGFWRTLGLAAAIVVAVGLTTAFAFSYGGNKSLAGDALDAARGIAAIPPNPVDLPPLDALKRLDALRMQVDTLSAYEHGGAPLHLRWGLYSGSRLYPAVRAAYFAAFSKLMFAQTRGAMVETLRTLPDAPQPTDEYSDTYTLLKAYLVTTSNSDKSTVAFLAPALMTRWIGSHSVDSARATLARRQFETYATELRYANPFPDTADVAAVEKGRSFLHQFAGSEHIYQGMLAEAAKTNPSVQFNKSVAGSAPYVVDGYEVPGAFTKGGAAFMLDAFKKVDKYLSGEGWVVGEDVSGIDKAKLVADLQGRYASDYSAQWRKFLSQAQVIHYDGVKDAARKLTVLSSNQSPLLALFSVASQNTAIDLPDVAKTFQPVQVITPPTATDKLIGDKNGPYMSALLALQSSLDQTANAQGPAAEQAASQAANNATAARTAARQIAAGFNVDQQGQVHTIVQNLLEAPVAYAEPLLRSFGADEINVRARTFCSTVRSTLAKYPFTPEATAQASLAEVTALIRPNTGSLWKFYNDALAGAIPKQGTQYVAKPDGNIKFSPSFVMLLNRAQALADVLYKNDSPDPHLSVTVQPVPGDAFTTVSVSLDGEVVRSSANGNTESARIDWPGVQHEAKLSAGNNGPEITMVGPYSGPWAVFQLFNAADDWKPAGNAFLVGWELATRTQRATTARGTAAKITVQVDAGAGSAVLRKGFFAGSDCGGNIAR